MGIPAKEDIRTLRIIRGLKLRDLAQSADVAQETLSKCERGLVVPDKKFFIAVANVLNVPAEELFVAHQTLLNSAEIGEGYVTQVAKEEFDIERTRPLDKSKLQILDLFCGVGGFSHGFELTEQYQVSAGLDLLPDRVETFSKNHPAATVLCRNIQYLDTNKIIESSDGIDIIIGGPPCQGFSSIRPFRNLTENDSRNNLYENFILMVNTIKPKWFVLENVVGLITHRQGNTLKTILSLFNEIGYVVDWKVLNAASYGLPQRRERLIMIGNNINKSFSWPAPTHYANGRGMAGKSYNNSPQLSMFDEELKPAITVMEAIHDLPKLNAGEAAEHYSEDIVPTEYEVGMRGNQTKLTLHESTKHSDKMLEIIRLAGKNRSALPEGLTTSGFSSSYSRLDPDIPSVTLTVNFVHPSSNKCIHPYQDRALTPREGARLQGFEDSYKFSGTRSQVVKQIGNAVPPLLGKIIAEALFEQFS